MIRPRAGSSSLALALLVCAASPLARAEPPSQAVVAEGLFQEGKRLLDEKRFAEACPKLAESFRLDPAGGTLLNLAICHEGEGRLATAWAELNEVVVMARKAGRASAEKLAQERIKGIEPRLPRLTVVVPPEADLPGLEVTQAGVSLGRAAWGTALPVDPGEVRVDAVAPWKQPAHLTARLREGERATVTIPRLLDAPGPTPPASAAPLPSSPPAASSAASTASSPEPPPPRAERGAVRTVGGAASLGAGAIALGLGAYFGLEAIKKRRDSDADCPGGACNGAGWTTFNDGRSAARASNVAFVVGAVGVAVGGVLLWLPSPSPAAKVGLGPGGVSLGGSW